MNWTHSNIVTLLQLAFFVLVLPFFFFNFFTLGKRLRCAWWFFIAFCLTKIVGDALLLADMIQESNGNPPNEGLLTPGFILMSISSAPLIIGIRLLLSKGRIIKTGKSKPSLVPIVVFLVTIGSVFSIAGYLAYIINNKYVLGATLVQGAAFVLLLPVLVLGYIGLHHIKYTPALYMRSFQIYAYATLAAMPFLLVRVVYFIGSAFALKFDGNLTRYATFNIFNGSWIAKLLMLVVMEMVVTLIFAGAGLISFLSNRQSPFTEDEDPLSPSSERGSSDLKAVG